MRMASERLCGEELKPKQLALIRQVVAECSGLSRMELARTVCELLRWKRPNGGLKARECRELLERLERRGVVQLPEKQHGRRPGSVTRVPRTAAGEPGRPLVGSLAELEPLAIERVSSLEQRLLFRELVGRHHPLGHKVPFGAQLRYLVFVTRPERTVVGALQFSSPAWRMAARDQWIGWDDATRRRNLQHIVSNSRFLLLPWVRVDNLASAVLARATRQLCRDWFAQYAVEPLLLETLVDTSRFHGGCYRAANWLALGDTTGRGRMDTEHLRHGRAPKLILVYPLVSDAARRLREG